MDSMEALFSLRGHVGLVTGASSGLGVECARALAIAGADVALMARRADRLEALSAELREKYRIKALAVAADVTVDADLEKGLERAVAELGKVDILVNNAGIAPVGSAQKISREVWEQTLAVNLTAPMMLAQKVARRLIAKKMPGRIINITSVLGQVASSLYRIPAYIASKAALANLTRELAVEWAPYGILVNSIAPGWLSTEMTELGLEQPEQRQRMELFTPLGRIGRPEELRGAIIFLASPAASYVTGSMLAVDGGYQAW